MAGIASGPSVWRLESSATARAAQSERQLAQILDVDESRSLDYVEVLQNLSLPVGEILPRRPERT